MSLAVEQTLPPPMKAEVDSPRSEGHAAGPLNMDAVPSRAARLEETLLAASQPIKKQKNLPSAAAAAAAAAATYDSMQSQYYDTMDVQEITTPTSDHQVVEEQAPVLPPKSALRASRMLDGLVGLKIVAPVDPPAFSQTPHDEYLSSEEEASATTDDFSDFEYESSSDDLSPSPAEDGRKHQVTARVVSVIFSGKPSMIQVPQNRRSLSPTSIEHLENSNKLRQAASHNDEMEVKSRRRMSTSTTSSRLSAHSFSRPAHLLRSSSMQPPGTSSRPNLPFLKVDPFANGSTYSLGNTQGEVNSTREAYVPQEVVRSEVKVPAEEDRPKTPKTPTKMFKGVARAMSLMKRRSVPRMNQAFLALGEIGGRPGSPSEASITEEDAEPPISMEQLPAKEPQETSPPLRRMETRSERAVTPPSPPTRSPPRPQLAPITHDEIVRIAERNARMAKHMSVTRTFQGEHGLESPISPMSPLTTPSPLTPNKRASTFTFGRRRMSVKLPGKLQL
ncbi:hypothetical protein M406DRAFT_67045 [Cryphonectria parasitica EP155]|uniref:Uncharacterized protein n=1 Tax=Cryphonectria parasitica (strain ATCC 38755 / EP155) TaxID=660469 RepID=A0A9P4YBX7_CRYP1|nr:uncharacterized protein M406DRAFT_67045 [Cryphonectria parasitica EP155]KAF3770662.1 hypothetical protein M406DRAFT_67045 [Cryphonectria parasitica EP155]